MPEDRKTPIWEEMRRIYKAGLLKTSSERRPGLMGLAERALGHLGMRSYQQPDVGFIVNFGDIQRMHMRYLHTKIVNTVTMAQPRLGGDGSPLELKALSEVGPLLDEYSRFDRLIVASAQMLPDLSFTR